MKSTTALVASVIGAACLLGNGCRGFEATLDEPTLMAGSGAPGAPHGGAGTNSPNVNGGHVATIIAGQDSADGGSTGGMAGQLLESESGAPNEAGTPGNGGMGVSGFGSVGAGGTDRVQPTHCELFSNCWSPPWPTPTIPIQLDSALSANAVSLAQQAMAEWTSPPMPAGFLEFVSGSPPASGLQLYFANDQGCGPSSLNDEQLRFALRDCETVTQVARELGVTLGVPRTEQRLERDRYLELANQSAFGTVDACNGNFFAKCDGQAGYPYDIGPFELASVMMGSGVATFGKGCSLVPAGARLFHRKDVLDDVGTSKCESDVPVASSVTPHDKAMLIELYKLNRATPFRAIPQWLGASTDATIDNLPVPTGITDDLRLTGEPALVEQGHGFLQLFAFANDGTLWRQGYSPLASGYVPGWGYWIPVAPLAPVGSNTVIAAVSSSRDTFDPAQQKSALELALVARGSVFAVRSANDAVWVNLGTPPGGVISAPAIASRGSDILEVFAIGAEGQLWVRESTGTDWSPWKATGNLPEGIKLTAQPAAHYDSRTGAVAVASRASDGALWLTMSTESSTWSAWQKIGGSELTGTGAPALVSGPAGFQVLVRGPDGLLWRRENATATDGLFEPLGGLLLGRPTADSTDANGIDIVGVISDPNTNLRAPWHKQTW